MVYLQLFWEFFKTGLFAIGGGLATLPFLYDMAERFTWFTEADLVNMIAISESTPGAIGINMATFAGYKAGGLAGGVLATFSLILPSLILVTIAARFLEKFRENRHVEDAFYGLRPAVVGLIAAAGLEVLKVSVFAWDKFVASGAIQDLFYWKAIILFVVLLVVNQKAKKLSQIVYLAAAAVIGIVFRF